MLVISIVYIFSRVGAQLSLRQQVSHPNPQTNNLNFKFKAKNYQHPLPFLEKKRILKKDLFGV